MKKIIFGLMVVLFSATLSATELKVNQIIQSGDEISCRSFNDIQEVVRAFEESLKEEDALSRKYYMQAIFRNVDCESITEGMDMKILKIQFFKRQYGEYSKGLLVKLPTGMTTWIKR